MQIQMNTMKSQEGIALIMVFLVVALVSFIATGIASKQNISTKRTYNLLNYEQAYVQLLGAEDWVKTILIADVDPANNGKGNNATEDSLDDWWNRDLQGNIGAEIKLPIENGVLTGKIEDLQGRFNINNLFNSSTQTPNPEYLPLMRNFIKAVNDSNKDVNIPIQTDAIVDWIDNDLDALPNGGEDGEYLSREIPYVAANQVMASATELIKITGFSYADYNIMSPPQSEKSSPTLIALPETTPININTAKEMQFRMLIPGINNTDIQAILDARSDGGFDNISDFTALAVVPNNLPINIIALRSNFFLLRI